MVYSFTLSDSLRIMMPIGMKTMPTMAKVMITAVGVRMGRHALSVCCRNGVSSGRLDFVSSMAHP